MARSHGSTTPRGMGFSAQMEFCDFSSIQSGGYKSLSKSLSEGEEVTFAIVQGTNGRHRSHRFALCLRRILYERA